MDGEMGVGGVDRHDKEVHEPSGFSDNSNSFQQGESRVCRIIVNRRCINVHAIYIYMYIYVTRNIYVNHIRRRGRARGREGERVEFNGCETKSRNL